MSAPYVVIFLLSLFLLLCVGCRFMLAVRTNRSRYVVGASKTIGSREIQEDFYAVRETQNGMLAVLSDGRGRGAGGRIASKIAVKTFRELFTEYNVLDHPSYFFQKAFQTANREILKVVEEGAGSAAVSAVMIRENQFYYAIVGNVKIAVFRKRELIPVGSGHTLNVLAEDKYYQGLLTREDALAMLKSKRVYNYLGKDGFEEIEFYDEPIHLKANDLIVLMSDGVYDGMDWKQIEDYLSQKKSTQKLAYDVIEHINRKQGNKDNASIVLIKVGDLT